MTANIRLQDAMRRAGITPHQLAATVQVDAKTVARWISTGRAPYPRTRHEVAKALGEFESVLWPDVVAGQQLAAVTDSEILQTYPHRSAVPNDLWRQLFTAKQTINVLAFSGLFLPETDPRLIDRLREKAREGVEVVLLMGDPDSDAIRVRGEDEGIGDAMAAKVRSVLTFYRPLVSEPNVYIGLHGTTLYNSIYRYDDQMLVNTHIYGAPAAHSPVHHLRRIGDGHLFPAYMKSFDRVRVESKALEEA